MEPGHSRKLTQQEMVQRVSCLWRLLVMYICLDNTTDCTARVMGHVDLLSALYLKMLGM